MTDISIIIVNWNTKDLLVNCVNSILSSKPKAAIEIVIVDNGSTDGSIEEMYKLKKSGKIQKIIENGKNLGFSKANNKGIRSSKGEYILLLNSDTEVKNGAIDELLAFTKNEKNIGVVGSQLLNHDGSIQASCFNFPTLSRAVRQYWFGEKNLYDKFYPKSNQPTAVDIVVGAALLITPEARQKVGLLNEKYFFFFEDLDYCRSVRSVGLEVYYLPSSKVVHFHGSTVRKVTTEDIAWKNLVPGSRIYHGVLMHYLINFVIWSGQKWQKIFKNTQ